MRRTIAPSAARPRPASSPSDFFAALRWLDGRPLSDVIEPYRAKILHDALYTFDADGRPTYNQVLTGRGKKNWKSADLILAAFYRFYAWPSAGDGFILANDEEQAADDLEIAKKLIAANPLLESESTPQSKSIVHVAGHALRILPARDVVGSHGKTYGFIGFDEIHGYRTWDLFEALSPDPTRPDALVWITSYASIYNAPGAPLYDLYHVGKAGTDPRMLFSWYAGDYTTDPDFEHVDTPEQRANPSMASWGNADYLEQQRRRLPSHKYRRLHLNLPGSPSGAYYDADAVMTAIVNGRRSLPPADGIDYVGFVDMSGGSSDDACLAIAHATDHGAVLDVVVKQNGKPPFNPRTAVSKFATLLKRYGIHRVTGDAYAGETFKIDFEAEGITYRKSSRTKSQLYEALEPALNAGEIELLDVATLQEQLLTLVMRGARIDHQSGDHDDYANAAAGALVLAADGVVEIDWNLYGIDDPIERASASAVSESSTGESQDRPDRASDDDAEPELTDAERTEFEKLANDPGNGRSRRIREERAMEIIAARRQPPDDSPQWWHDDAPGWW